MVVDISESQQNRMYVAAASLSFFGLVGIAFADARGAFGDDIGLKDTLRHSSFARIMFADIGALSTIIAAWMILATNHPLRFVFAFASLFIGSFAVLPFLVLYFLGKAART